MHRRDGGRDSGLVHVDAFRDGLATDVADLEWARALATRAVSAQKHHRLLALHADRTVHGVFQLLQLLLQHLQPQLVHLIFVL